MKIFLDGCILIYDSRAGFLEGVQVKGEKEGSIFPPSLPISFWKPLAGLEKVVIILIFFFFFFFLLKYLFN